jgi:aerobic carbon-monoxide dehydrogenase small subunit
MVEPNLQPAAEIDIATTVNGHAVRRRVKVRQHLADFVRDELGFTGTHLGCEHGSCGSCSVLLDGEVVRGCLTLAVQVHGRSVQTIEGLSDSGVLGPLQRAFAERNAAQCGFCTPGMLISAHQLLATGQPASRAAIREFLSGNLCRCTGYQSIIDAVSQAMREQQVGRPVSEQGRPGE